MKTLLRPLVSLSAWRAGFGALALLAGVIALPAATSQAAEPQRTFLGQVADTTTGVHDNPGWTGVTQGAEKAEEAFKKALEQGLATAEQAEKFKTLGKYVKVLDYGLKIIKFGDLGVQGIQALQAGDRRAFCEIFNKALREAVKTGAGMAGSAGGAALGTAGGGAIGGLLSLPAGGVGALATGAIGAFAGGWLGDYLGSEAAGAVYDYFLQDWVKSDLAGSVFDALSGQQPQAPPLLPPPLTGGGGTGSGTGGGSGGSSGGGARPPSLKPFR